MKPKYMKIYEDLSNKIKETHYKPGDLLPTEKLLCDEYSTSRMTVNKAMNKLVDDLILERRRGIGSIVLDPPIKKEIQNLTSFEEDMKAMGKNPNTQLLKYEYSSQVDNKIVSSLGINKDEFVHIIHRLRTADDIPVALNKSYLSTRVIKEFDIAKSLSSIYRYYETELKLDIDESNYKIQAIEAPDDVANCLEVPLKSPVLKITHTSSLVSGEIIEYCITYYRADKYFFSMKAKRVGAF